MQSYNRASFLWIFVATTFSNIFWASRGFSMTAELHIDVGRSWIRAAGFQSVTHIGKLCLAISSWAWVGEMSTGDVYSTDGNYKTSSA